jgi:filamentous hemagglutinin family protein
MNSSYRSLWNDSTGTFVAVPENASSAGKKTSSRTNATGANTRFTLQTLAVSVMLAFGANALAQPTGGVVAAGAATISTGATSTTINQSTQNAVINWQSFNIAAGQSVQFVQPNSNSVALNRVLGADPSNILGSLSANGKVFLVNPNGILFGRGASVNVGGLLASTLDISNSDFMAGNYKFSGNGTGAVLNQGNINADGGYVALLGANVSNEGVISAQLGSVVLAAGSVMTMDVAGDGLLNIAVNEGAVNALVQNGGLIRADGGRVLLTTQAAGSLLQNAVNNTGVIQAQTLVTGEKGSIMLMGDMESGTVNVGGTLDASAPNGGDGGFIETSAANVQIASDANVTTLASAGTTGTWLIDPTDFTIGSEAGDNIAGVTLSALLVTNSVVIDTATGIDATDAGATPPVTGYPTSTAGTGFGDIFVNDAVTWTPTPSPTTLTLRAARDVNVNAAITATGGNFVVCCGRDINVNAAVTTTDGDVSLNAGRDIVIAAAMTTTRGDVLLRAGGEASAAVPGLIGGTVVFGPGILYTVTGSTPAVSSITIDSTPANYAVPNDYSTNFTGTASSFLTQRMLVFAQGNDKVYDGNTDATLTFRGDPTVGGTLDVSLTPGTGTFDDKNVASDIGISYTGLSLGGTNANQFALWGVCSAEAGSGRTSAAITPAPLTLQADNATKVYGTAFAPANTAFTTPVAPVAGETVTSVAETSDGSAADVSVAGGPYQIDITPGSATGTNGFIESNYDITYLPGALSVTPLAISGGITAADKPYDANTSATITGRPLTGVLFNDEVTYTGGSATFDTPTAGVDKPVTGTGLGLSGTDAGNYTVNDTATTTATITSPDVVVPPDVVDLPETPVELPIVNPPVGPNAWPPVVVLPLIPPQLTTLTPPVVLAPAPVPVPVVVTPPSERVEPVVQPVPQPYVAPIRPRKQDRN